MIKCICDKCGKEVQVVHSHTETEDAFDGYGNKIISFNKARCDLCNECNDKFNKLDLDIADFMKLSDKEIDLLLNAFKVGDMVITADGREGVITSVCTCDRCKERGFYEPTIKFEDGGTDYIMISDKNNGFKSYYQIGNHFFGNLNEESVIRELNEINNRRANLESQLATILVLKQVGRTNHGN